MGYVAPKPTVSSGAVVSAQRISASSTSSATSFSVFDSNTNLVVIQVQSNDIYVTFDGTTPSGTNGAQMFSGQSYHWSTQTAKNAKFTMQSATATLYLQECVTSLDKSAMPFVEVLKPRLSAF